MSFDTSKIIHLASDHAGFEYKEFVREWLMEEGFSVVDHGAKVYDAGDDFPDFISLAAAAVSASPETTRGIIFGGSGQGEAMLANRYKQVRATVYYGGQLDIIALSRAHNDANVLSIGSRFVPFDEVKEGITLWLSNPVLTDEKYKRRNQKIEKITRDSRAL